MEFFNGILVEVSGHKRESSQTPVFLPHFSILHYAIHEFTGVFIYAQKHLLKIPVDNSFSGL
jgi:hypothetical protein